jgi:hypothetical protein
VEVQKKTTLAPSTKKRGRAETTRKDTASEKRPKKENQKLLENPRMWFNQMLNNTIQTQMIHSLVLKHAIQMRLEHQKFLTTSYWEIMRHQRE